MTLQWAMVDIVPLSIEKQVFIFSPQIYCVFLRLQTIPYIFSPILHQYYKNNKYLTSLVNVTLVITEEEKRKTMREQQKYVQQNEQYKDRLTRKRHDDQLGNIV
eukprot:sb/3478082/